MALQRLLLALFLVGMLILGGCQSSDPTQSPPDPEPVDDVARDGGEEESEAAPQEEAPPAVAANPESTAQERLDREIERLQIKDQKKDVVSEYFLSSAEKFMAETNYQAARDNLLNVLELNPSAPIQERARRLLAEVDSQLGIGQGNAKLRLQEEANQVAVRVSQAMQQVQVRRQEGLDAMQADDYETAIRRFDSAIEILRWLPYHAPSRQLESQLLDLKEQALERKEEWQRKQAKEQREEARLAEEVEEKSRERYLREKVSSLFRKANIAFKNEEFTQAEQFSDQILVHDPFNKDAKRLREIAISARYAQMSDQIQERYIEEWQQTWEGMSRRAIPQHETVRYPDDETWKKIVNRPVESDSSEGKRQSPAVEEVLRILNSTNVGVLKFENTPLSNALGFFERNYDLNIIVDQTALADKDDLDVSIGQLTDVSLRTVLDLTLSSLGLSYEIDDSGVIVVKDKAEIEANTIRIVYPVQDLILKVPDFPGVPLELTADDEESIGVDFGGSDDDEDERLSTDILRDLIEQNIAQESWDSEHTGITERNGRLIIRQSPEVHEQIKQLLSQLRRSTGLLVTIETRFLQVRDDFLQDIGVDFRGLGAQSPRGDVLPGTIRFPGTDPATAALAGTSLGTVVPAINPVNLFNSNINDPLLNVSGGTQRAPGLTRSEVGSYLNSSASIGTQYGQADTPLDDVLFGAVAGGSPEGVGTDNTAGIFFDNGNEADVRGRVEHLFATAFGTTSILTNSGGATFQFGFLDEIAVNMILSAVEKSERINILTAPRLTAFNTQRANVAVLRQFGYVRDFDVQVAQNAVIADPIIGVVQDGVVLDVKPVISADRKFITMELQPAFAEVEQPIRQLQTTLGGGAGTVTIELPEISLRKVETTVTIPDGGTVMIGGLSRFQERERQSDVPFFKRVPFLNFFFSRRQKLTFREELIILVKGEIVYWEDIEPDELASPE